MGKRQRRQWQDYSRGDKRTKEGDAAAGGGGGDGRDGAAAADAGAGAPVGGAGAAAGAGATGDAGYKSLAIARSPAFDAYYRAQCLVPDDEYETFAETLLLPLPITFRINPMSPLAGSVRHRCDASPERRRCSAGLLTATRRVAT